MNNIFDFFDQIYCINLPNDKDRKEHIISELRKFDLEHRTQFISANPPPSNFRMSNFKRSSVGEFGVNLSQIKAVVHAIHNEARHPLFLEDDIVFNKNTEERLSNALKELPSNWDVLYLGGHPRAFCKKHSKTLVKVDKFSFADAYSINRKSLINFFDMWAERISGNGPQYDIILGDYAARSIGYCVYPIVCEQKPGKSGITNQNENKKELINTRWQRWLK